MKQQLTKLLTVLLLLTLCIAAFAACGGDEADPIGTMQLVLLDGDDATVYEIPLSELPANTDATGLVRVLDYLQAQDKLTYTIANGMFSQVGPIREDAGAGIYVYLYTSVAKDLDVSIYATTIEYDGKTYTNSGVGAEQMTLEDGCVIIVTTIVFGA